MIRLARALDGPGPRTPQTLRRRSGKRRHPRRRANRPGALRPLRRQRLPGRHLHPARRLRPRQSLPQRPGASASPGRLDLGGKFQKARDEDPYRIPASWLKSKDRLRLSTPYNFVSTADTHGGNSGSATLNTAGRNRRHPVRRQHRRAAQPVRLHRPHGPQRSCRLAGHHRGASPCLLRTASSEGIGLLNPLRFM
jgi:hypothetical protein